MTTSPPYRPGERSAAVVAAVLSPREGFSPQASGAIGLMVHRLAAGGSRFAAIVIGAASAHAPYAESLSTVGVRV